MMKLRSCRCEKALNLCGRSEPRYLGCYEEQLIYENSKILSPL